MTLETPFSLVPFQSERHAYHDDTRTSWITRPRTEPARATVRQRIALFLVALGGRIGSVPPDDCPDPAMC